MDLTREVIYRGVTLNVQDMDAARVPGVGIGSGQVGCVLDSVDISDVDVVQFLEKRSQSDGMDAGEPFLGTRRIRMAGTLYNVTRALLYDDLASLRAAFSPVLAAREEPLDYGYRPLYFVWPTNRVEDYLSGAIELQVKAMPRAFSANFNRDQLGGGDEDALAIPWQATLICKDPAILGAEPVDILHTAQTIVTGGTAAAATNLVTKAAHGLVAGDRVRFTTLTGGTGLSLTTTYYVIASGLTSGVFKVSTVSAGSEVDITVNYSAVSFVKSVTDSGTLTNRGTYLANVSALWAIGPQSGVISGTIGDTVFSIAIPASVGNRSVRFDGANKVLTIEEDSEPLPRNGLITFSNDTTWPLIDPGDSAYSITFHGCVVQSGSHTWFYEQYA